MNHLKKRSLSFHAGRHKSDINLLLIRIVFTNFRSNQVPNLSILPLLHRALMTFIEIQEPVLLSEEFPFKRTPFDLFVLIYHQVVLFELMTADHNGLVLVLNTLAKLSITAEALYLMPLFALMLSILYTFVMLLITLLPAQWTMLVTADSSCPKVFFRVAN